MNVSVRRSNAEEKNQAVIDWPRSRSTESNLSWLARARTDGPLRDFDPASHSLILLLGGVDPLSFRLRLAQAHVRHDLSPSAWSLALFLPGLEVDRPGDSRTLGVALAPARWYPPHGYAPSCNAVQQGRLAHYASAQVHPNIAALAMPVPSGEVRETIESKLQFERSGLDLGFMLLRWLQFAWGAGMPANPLGEGVGMPSAVLLEAAFAAHGFDLTPGLESRSSCPEAIWQAARWWYRLPAPQRAQDGPEAPRPTIFGACCVRHALVPESMY